MGKNQWFQNLPPSSRTLKSQKAMSFSTGLGVDGSFQKYNPTGVMNTTAGPRTVHEGEKVNVKPDGTFDVIPAAQVGGQQNLAGLEGKLGIKGYAEGTAIGEPFQTTAPITPTLNLGATSTQADMSGVLVKNQDTTGINNYMDGLGLKAPDPVVNTAMSSITPATTPQTNPVTNPSQSVANVGTTANLNTTTDISGLAGKLQDIAPVSSSATATSAESQLLGLGNAANDQYGIANTANQIANTNTDVNTAAVGQAAQSVTNAAQETVDTSKMAGIADKLANTSVDTQTDIMQDSASKLSGVANQDLLTANIDKTTTTLDDIVSQLDSMDVNAPDRPTNQFETELANAVKLLRDYSSGNSYADRVASNIAMQQLDAKASVASIKQAQSIASNKNLTEGQKNAAYAMLNRDISSQRAVLSGDLAKAASERAFNAAQQLGTLTLQASAYVEDKYKTDVAKANTSVELAINKAKTMSDIELSGLDTTSKLALQQAAQQADAAQAAASVQAQINEVNMQAAQLGMQGLVAAGNLTQAEADIKLQEVGQKINALVSAGQLSVEQAKLMQTNISTKLQALTTAGNMQLSNKELAMKSLETAANIGISQATLQQQASRITMDAMIASGELDLGLLSAEQAQQRMTLDKMIASGELSLKADDLERLYKQQNLDAMSQQVNLAIKAGDWALASSLTNGINKAIGGPDSGLNTSTLQKQMNQLIAHSDLEITQLKDQIGADKMTAVTEAINAGTDLATVNKQFGTTLTQTAFDSIKQNGVIGDKSYERQLNMVTTLLATPGAENKKQAATILNGLYPGTAIDFSNVITAENSQMALDTMAEMSELVSSGTSWDQVPLSTVMNWTKSFNASGGTYTSQQISTLFSGMKKNVVDEQWKVVEESEVYKQLLATDPKQAALIKGVFESSTFNTQGFTMVETITLSKSDGSDPMKFSSMESANAYKSKHPEYTKTSNPVYSVAFVDPTTGNVIRQDSTVSGGTGSTGEINSNTITSGAWKEGGVVNYDGSLYKVENGKAVPFSIGADFDYFGPEADTIVNVLGNGSPYYDKVVLSRAKSYLSGDVTLDIGNMSTSDPVYKKILSQTPNVVTSNNVSNVNSGKYTLDESEMKTLSEIGDGAPFSYDGRLVVLDQYMASEGLGNVPSVKFTDVSTGYSYQYFSGWTLDSGGGISYPSYVKPVEKGDPAWNIGVPQYSSTGEQIGTDSGPIPNPITVKGEPVSTPDIQIPTIDFTNKDLQPSKGAWMGNSEPPEGYNNGTSSWSKGAQSWVPNAQYKAPTSGTGGAVTAPPDPTAGASQTVQGQITPTTTPQTPTINFGGIANPPSGVDTSSVTASYAPSTALHEGSASAGDISANEYYDGKQWIPFAWVTGPDGKPKMQFKMASNAPTQNQAIAASGTWDGKAPVTEYQWNTMSREQRNAVPFELVPDGVQY